MVNEEHLKEVKDKYGACECGADVEYVILKETFNRMYHINFVGELSKRYIVRNNMNESPILVEGLCLNCYRKKGYDKMEDANEQRKKIRKKILKELDEI